MLFRKFSADFSEKYRTKPLSLTPEAKEILLRYTFPGNIRQLKNLVEQMSVLEMKREISSEKLLKYLPAINTLPALANAFKTNDESLSERDLLYKVLFDLRKDVNELKAVLSHPEFNYHIGDSSSIFEKVSTLTPESPETAEKQVFINNEKNQGSLEINPVVNKDMDVQDIAHIAEEDDSLSLEKREKELIIKALQKNNNKRKYAAQDLGISERTLYRKIKQYQIDE